jgi:hypothetical protein
MGSQMFTSSSVAKGMVLGSPENINNFTKAALYISSTLNVTLINLNYKKKHFQLTSGPGQKQE